jgi:hypothetical protein
MIRFWNNLHQVPHTNTNVDIELSVHDTFLKKPSSGIICIGVSYLMKVISEAYHAHLIQYLHLYWCEVPDESYFRNVSYTLISISTFVLV